MRVLDLRDCNNGRERGLKHGRLYAGEIAKLAELRIYLACLISGFERDGLLRTAEEHLPILEEFDAELHAELLAIAESAGLPPSHLVVLNQYTDIRDIKPPSSVAGDADYDGGCTMIWARCQGRPVYAQTWDMHCTAMPFMTMLRVTDAGGDDAWVLSLTGCLGMTGLNAAGLCIGINNLTSTDAQAGVPWSAIVRRSLRETKASAARDLLLKCRMGSGHNYLVADDDEVFAVETSGTLRKVIFSGEAEEFVHCNHCLDQEIASNSRVPDKSTTFDRQTAMEAALAKCSIIDVEDAWQRLGSQEGFPRSICTNMSTPENPHAAATCAGIAIDIQSRRILAVAGFTHEVAPEHYDFQAKP